MECQVGVGPPAKIEMDVILDAADVVEDALLGADDAADVWIETLSNVVRDPRSAAFGGEDDVKEKLRIGAGHV